MPHDPRKSLEDMRRAADFLVKMTAGRSREDYRTDELFRSAIERKFEIIGEALNRIHKADAILATRITAYRQIISLRNILIHGYDIVDDELIWNIVEVNLPDLKQQIDQILAENDSTESTQ